MISPIIPIILLSLIILNLGAMSYSAFTKKKNLLLILSAVEIALIIVFRVII